MNEWTFSVDLGLDRDQWWLAFSSLETTLWEVARERYGQNVALWTNVEVFHQKGRYSRDGVPEAMRVAERNAFEVTGMNLRFRHPELVIENVNWVWVEIRLADTAALEVTLSEDDELQGSGLATLLERVVRRSARSVRPTKAIAELEKLKEEAGQLVRRSSGFTSWRARVRTVLVHSLTPDSDLVSKQVRRDPVLADDVYIRYA